MKKILFLSLVVALCAAGRVQAAVITWQTPVDIIDEFDVSTDGTLVEALNLRLVNSPGTNLSPIVNGVQFVEDTLGVMPDGTSTANADFYISGTPGDPYDDLLSTLGYGTSPVVLGHDLLEVSKSYQLQIWFVDYRSEDHLNRMMSYNDGNGNATEYFTRKYVIGTFTADDTTLSIGITYVNQNSPHMTAYQLREIPEPTTLLLLGMGAVLIRKRHK